MLCYIFCYNKFLQKIVIIIIIFFIKINSIFFSGMFRVPGFIDGCPKFHLHTRPWLFLLSQIPNDRDLCVDVQFDREYYVGVVQAAPIKVYDYYEPGEIKHFSCASFRPQGWKMPICNKSLKFRWQNTN